MINSRTVQQDGRPSVGDRRRFGVQALAAGVLCASITRRCRQTSYGDYYTLTYEQQSDGTWTIHCSEAPHNPYGGGVTDHHLYSSGKVCVSSGHEPRSLDRAKAIAAAWCDGYSAYVRSGSFPKGSRRYNV